MIDATLTGFLSGASLIIAIGAQNAYVLRQGITRRHVLAVVAICALSDLVLITAGVGGLGALITAHPIVLTVSRWFGAVFLVSYGVLSLWRARHDQRLDPASGGASRLSVAVLTALGFTWLNPHVYLDTVVLLGSLSASHGALGRWWFAAGAGTASIVWFSALGFGARHVEPVFRRPVAWRVLDVLIAVVMFALAGKLLLG